MKALVQRVRPAVIALEEAVLDSFERDRDAVAVIEQAAHAETFRALLRAGVVRASAVPDHSHRQHEHLVLPLLTVATHSRGSNNALTKLIEELARRSDNMTKLATSGTEERHLFVWLDWDTEVSIARPLHGNPPSWIEDDSYGLPSIAPVLDPAITHLWVVHEGSGCGWLWDGRTWLEIPGQ